MSKVSEEATKAGVLVFNCGIAPTAMGAKLTCTDGQLSVTDGPFTEAKELVGGWGLVEARDLDEGGRMGEAVPGRRRRRRDAGPTDLVSGSAAASTRAGGWHRRTVPAPPASRPTGTMLGSATVTVGETNAAIEAVIRVEWARLIAGLARSTGEVGLAEKLAQDAVVAALEQWPESGVPRNPGAWLMTVAKRRAIDLYRRNARLRDRYDAIGRDLATDGHDVDPDFDHAVSDDIDDDLLRLVFTACHPVLSVPARVALTLRLLGGLTTVEIARAFLVPEATVAQRIVRAKTLAAAHVPFEVPEPAERPARLASVLEVIYLIFNEGYAATEGEDWVRPALRADALRLGRVLAQLAAGEPEVHGLAALARAEELGGAYGRYALQAAIAACHARAVLADDTDWARIAALYAVLAPVMPSPVVALNRAVAVSMAVGPQAGLDLVDALADEPTLRSYSCCRACGPTCW